MLSKTLQLLTLSAALLLGASHAKAQLPCIWEGGIVKCPEDCSEQGGLAQCTAPIVTAGGREVDQKHEPETMFKYVFCETAPSSSNSSKWCNALSTESTWDSVEGCLNRPSWSTALHSSKESSVLVPVSDRFVESKFRWCTAKDVTDTGWGQDGAISGCSLATSRERNGIPLWDYRQLYFSGKAWRYIDSDCSVDINGYGIQLRRARELTCPTGYKKRNLPNGDLQCYREVSERCAVGNPLYLPTGEKCQVETDYSAGGTGGLPFTRHYRSGSFFRPTWEPAEYTDGAAERWRHSYQHKLHVAPADNTHILGIVARANGTLLTFDKSGKEIVHLQGGGARIEHDAANQRYRLTHANASIEDYAEDGRLLSITSRAGRTTTLNYNSAFELISIEDAHGRTLVLTDSDADGLIDTITPPDGQTISYTYNDLGLLETITYPNSEQRTYHYDDPNYLYGLSGITDENNQRFASWGYDTRFRAIFSEHANGAERVDIEYLSDTSIRVTDSLNKVHNYQFQSVGGKLRIDDKSR